MVRLKVVLDTNIVVSAHLKPDGFERSVLILALTDPAGLFVTPEILIEYEEVLRRPKFNINPAQIDESLKHIQARAVIINPTVRVSACSDPDDDKFLECAEDGRVDYLVTGNKRHFPKRWGKTKVVNAREFIDLTTTELQQ